MLALYLEYMRKSVLSDSPPEIGSEIETDMVYAVSIQL